MGVFLGLNEGTNQDIIENYLTSEDIPLGMLPIGYDGGDNNILLALDGPAGRVYFQDKDTGKFYLCANTFTDFLDSFVPLEEKGT